jgi:phage repressor protein C with HTH and peptisase S24 domain
MRRLIRSWRARVAVEGHSMEPTLRAGDWLLVDPHAYRDRPPRKGDLVVAADPRAPDGWLVKRVAALNPDGSLRLAGDHAAHQAEPELEAVPPAALVGRPWFRYWPAGRVGRVG